MDGRSEDCGTCKLVECYEAGEAALLDGFASLAQGASRWRLVDWTGVTASVEVITAMEFVLTLASFSASGMSLSVSLVKSLSALRTSPDILKCGSRRMRGLSCLLWNRDRAEEEDEIGEDG